ncbi:MAG: hypothetical protein AABZ60_13875, partial [Planctomycetota bacterium]
MNTERTFFFHFHFRKDFIERGGNPLAIFEKLRALGQLTVIPHPTSVPLLSEYNPKELYLKWTIKLVTLEHQSHIERILLPLTADEKNQITLELATLPPPDPETVEFQENTQSNLPKIITQKMIVPLLHMLVKIGKNIFSIPHQFILEFLTLEANQIQETSKGGCFDFKGKSVRLI